MAIEKVPVLGRPLGQLAFAEAKRNWPFLLGFAVTLTGVVQLSLALPSELFSILAAFAF